MKKNYIIPLLMTVILMVGYQSAFTLGMSLSRNNTVEPTPSGKTTIDTFFPGIVQNLAGTVIFIDTAVAKNRLFNYRLNIEGSSNLAREDYIPWNSTYRINSLTCSNIFGFGFVRTQFMRIWAGPEVALSYEYKNRLNTILDPIIYHKIGPVIGANFHTSEETTLCFEMGFRAGFGFNLSKSPSNTYVNSKIEPHAGVKLIFRSWDMFVPSGV